MGKSRPDTGRHPDEEALHRLAGGAPPPGRALAREIERHVAACALCREKLRALREFYAGIARGLEGSPTDRDARLAASISAREALVAPVHQAELKKADEKVFETYAEVMVPSGPTVALRVIRAMKMYPVRSAGGAALVVALLLLMIRILPPNRDGNPYFAEIRNYVLTVYNRESEVLWTKPVPGLPDSRSDAQSLIAEGDPNRFVALADEQGGDVKDVLVTGATYDNAFSRDTLYCFDGRGELKWKIGSGSWVSFGAVDQNRLIRGGIVDFTSFRRSPGEPPQTFVLWSQETFSPTKLAEIRLTDGAILHSFFNKGGGVVLRHADIDGDGVEELLVGGVNDGFNKAFLAVLDPARIDGYAPVPRKFVPAGLNESPLKDYILFPYSPFPAHVRESGYGTLVNLIIAPRRPFQADVREFLYDPDKGHPVMASLFFSMDSTLRIVGVMPDDVMSILASRYGKAGLSTRALDRQAFEALRDSALYWDGERFEHAPVLERGVGPF